jgi:cell division protein FtsB
MRGWVKRWVVPPVTLAALVGGVVLVAELSIDPELQQRNAELGDELVRIHNRNEHLTRQVRELRDEIRRLRTRPAEQLLHARTELGLVRPGETVYQLAPPSPERIEKP